MNELELLLLAPNRVTPEDLRAAGYAAARAHLTKQANLSEEVAKYAREKNLNDNQIERVVETANQAVFGNLFKTAESKQIEFPVADPRIVRELLRREDSAKTASFLDVEMTMLRQRNRAPSRDIEQFFGVTKVAELDQELVRREMGRDILGLMDLRNELGADLATARDKAKTAAMEMQTKVKQYIDLSGENPEAISEAITGIARNQSLAKTAALFLFGDEVGAHAGLTKTARLINEEHPIVQAYREYEDAIVDVVAREQLLADVIAQQSTVRTLAAQTDHLLGLAAEGRELIKEATEERDNGKPTYAYSRFLTSPAAQGLTGLAVGGGLGAAGVHGMRTVLADAVKGVKPDEIDNVTQSLIKGLGRKRAMLGAVLGGGALLGGGAALGTDEARNTHAEALRGRLNMGGGALNDRERSLQLSDLGKQAAAEKGDDAPTHPVSRFLTNPAAMGLIGAGAGGYLGGKGAAALYRLMGSPADDVAVMRLLGGAAGAVGLGAPMAAGTAVSRRLNARAMEGRANKGGEDLTERERKIVGMSKKAGRIKGITEPVMDRPKGPMSGGGKSLARGDARSTVQTPEGQPKLASAAPTFMQRAGTFLKLLKPKNVPDMDYLPGAARKSLGDEAEAAFKSRNADPNGLKLTGQDLQDEIARIRSEIPSHRDLESRMKALEVLDPKGMKTEYEATQFGKGAGRAAGMMAVGIPAIAASHALVTGGEDIGKSRQGAASWKKFSEAYPDLAKLPSTQAQFKTLWSIAPNVAKDPAIAGPWLRRVDSMGGRDVGLDVKAVRDVADLEKAIGDARASQGYAGGSVRMQLARALAGAGG